MIDRIYESLMRVHLEENRQMFFLMGPRQVGKTTSCRRVADGREESHYLNWDNRSHRETILAGPERVAEYLELDRLREETPLVVFDEIHKWGDWKGFLKGLFDTHGSALHIVVTGSARLDVFRAGGDSLMGRYFGYRMHPVSVAELCHAGVPDEPIRPPRQLGDAKFESLLQFGGFPEPLERADEPFYNRWRSTRSQLLFREDLRDLTRIRELGQVEVLAEQLARRVGGLVRYSDFARDIDASVKTIKRWLETLSRLYYCFSIQPWFENVSRALRKQPKYYLWDWSLVDDPGARAENFVGSALLKAVHLWTDLGLGDFRLHFIRDKEQNEVDFVVVRDDEPWLLVEVKRSGSTSLSSSLYRFRDQTGAEHALQVAVDADFVDRDCFALEEPTIVPARTFLSQLI